MTSHARSQADLSPSANTRRTSGLGLVERGRTGMTPCGGRSRHCWKLTGKRINCWTIPGSWRWCARRHCRAAALRIGPYKLARSSAKAAWVSCTWRRSASRWLQWA